MVKHDGEIILPVFFLNAIGICFLFLIEGEVFTSDNSNRTLKENSQLNYFHTNLRGSILKININRNINNISNINNEINTLKTFKENETIEDKKQLRKLIQNTYLFYFNIFPAFISLIIIFSFGAEEEGHCELNDCGEGTFFFFGNSDTEEYHHHHHHHHRHHDDEDDDDDDDDKNDLFKACVLICFIIMIVVFLVSIFYLISKACGKYIARIVSMVILCFSYGGMAIYYILKINDDDYDKIYYLIGITISLFIINLLGLILPFIINSCVFLTKKPISTINVDGPLLHS